MNNSIQNPNNNDTQEDNPSISEQFEAEFNQSNSDEISRSEVIPEIEASKINEIFQPEVDEEVIFPSYSLFRNKNQEIEVLKYQPGDLITVILKNTGTSKSTTIEMFDSRDQSRYMGRSGGQNHEWTTRIQRTTILGGWRFTAQGPFIDENNLFSIDIPFEIVEYIPDEIPVEEIEIEEEGISEEAGYEELIQFAISEKINIPVIEIKGVGPSYQRRMNDVNIFYFHEILQSDPQTLSDQTSTNQIKIEMWFAFVEKVLQNQSHQLVLQYGPAVTSRLANETPSTIKGIGPVMEKKLFDAGFKDVKSIADSNSESIVKEIHVTVKKAQIWIDNAKELLSEMPEIKDLISTDKIELTSSGPPERIIGVGPATAKKLVSGGLKSIKDVAEADISRIIEILNSEKRAIKVHEGAKLLLSNL